MAETVVDGFEIVNIDNDAAQTLIAGNVAFEIIYFLHIINAIVKPHSVYL